MVVASLLMVIKVIYQNIIHHSTSLVITRGIIYYETTIIFKLTTVAFVYSLLN